MTLGMSDKLQPNHVKKPKYLLSTTDRCVDTYFFAAKTELGRAMANKI